MPNRLSNQFWDLLSGFFDVARKVLLLYETYEGKVRAYSDERAMDRRHLRLSGEEVAGLLDFRLLDGLCRDTLSGLVQISHNIFRGDVRTDALDRYITQIFHEMSILRDEQFKVAQLAPGYLGKDASVSQSIIDEVHEAFPRHVHAIHDLVSRAKQRIDELLPAFRRDRITLRSVYLFGDELFEPFYINGYEDVLAVMFPEGGTHQGLLETARSFHRAGFVENALEAVERAQRLPRTEGRAASQAVLDAVLREVEELHTQLKAEQLAAANRRRARRS